MMALKDSREKPRRKEVGEWSSDDDCHGSEGDWRSDNEWNEDSSLAGEASVMSEGTEEQKSDEDEERPPQRDQKPKKHHINKPSKLNLDDVMTEDDGESRHPEDITEGTAKNSKSNASDISDLSDIEDQIAEAQHKFMDDKQSLSGMMGLVDEVTMKGEKLTRKASETSLVVERDTLKKCVLSNDQLSLFDDDEISFRSYTDRTNVEEDDHIPQRDFGKITSGQIEYMNHDESGEKDVPKLTLGIGHIEYLGENKSDDSGSLISEDVGSSISKNLNGVIKDAQEDEKTKTSENNTEAEDLSESKSHHKSDRSSLKSSKSNDTFISRISNQLGEDSESEHENNESCTKEIAEEMLQSEQHDRLCNSLEFKEFEDPECAKLGEKHLCCFINLGGGGDDGRQNELVNRLKKLKDDITNMRKELSLARQECKKESEEVAKLIESAAARNKAAENSEVALPNNSSNILPTYAPNYTLEEIIPTAILAHATILPGRTQVAIPASLLEDRLRTTRQTASSTYRESLNELERMVEKEMASIKDSMTRLEPLNKISAEWDAVLPVRDPKRTTYKSDYRLEMVTSEMRLKAPEVHEFK